MSKTGRVSPYACTTGLVQPEAEHRPACTALRVDSVRRLERFWPKVLKKFCVAGSEADRREASGITVRTLALLRVRCHSVLLKKNSLFLITGPPNEYPNWLRVYVPFGLPTAASS